MTKAMRVRAMGLVLQACERHRPAKDLAAAVRAIAADLREEEAAFKPPPRATNADPTFAADGDNVELIVAMGDQLTFEGSCYPSKELEAKADGKRLFWDPVRKALLWRGPRSEAADREKGAILVGDDAPAVGLDCICNVDGVELRASYGPITLQDWEQRESFELRKIVERQLRATLDEPTLAVEQMVQVAWS